MPESIDPCIIHINEQFITVSTASGKAPEELLAKAYTSAVLEELIGTQVEMGYPLGILPRGVRYISGDSCTFCIEYEPQECAILLPKWSQEKRGQRIIKAWLPKHFICVRFDMQFKTITALAIAASYGYNYTLDDLVQPIPGLTTFDLPVIPTPELRTSYLSVGDFLRTLHERVTSVGFSLLPQESFDPFYGPEQFDQSIDKSEFWQWWVNEGDHALEWTFRDTQQTSTLKDLLYVPEVTVDHQVGTYPETLLRILTSISNNDILPGEREVMIHRAEMLKHNQEQAEQAYRQGGNLYVDTSTLRANWVTTHTTATTTTATDPWFRQLAQDPLTPAEQHARDLAQQQHQQEYAAALTQELEQAVQEVNELTNNAQEGIDHIREATRRLQEQDPTITAAQLRAALRTDAEHRLELRELTEDEDDQYEDYEAALEDDDEFETEAEITVADVADPDIDNPF